ncbi:MAG: T9SS type A sorting domain-containing protein [Fibrobacter sp.]|nr:T9SS type A sorting domain-containing protein [Fibrobacter sp.]
MFEKMKSVYFLATLCFSTSISFAAWDGSAVTPPSSDSTISLYNCPTTVPIYHISTPEQLAGLAEVVNTVDSSGTDPWKGYYFAVLENDIVFGDDTSSVSDELWVPIGVMKGLVSVMHFDGNGHTIYGLNLTGVADSVFGLFGFLENAELKNLTIANFSASITPDYSFWAGDFYGGSLVGRAEYSHIHNVHSRGGTMHVEVLPETTLRDSTNKKYYIGVEEVHVGGIVGSLKGSIDSSSNASDIEVAFKKEQFVGGVAGEVSRKIEGSVDSVYHCSNSGNVTSRNPDHYMKARVGGIVGRTTMLIYDCQNTGTISGEYGSVGGIVGSGDKTGNVYDCENSGAVSSEALYAGGVAGFGSLVFRSVNKGRVEGSDAAGGIVGNAGSATFCINEGYVKGVVVGGISGNNDDVLSQNINRGTLYGDTVGGICGRNLGVISSSYSYTSNASATDVIGGLVGSSQGMIVSSAFDSTLQRSVELVGVANNGHSVIESFALSTKEMQSVEFADKLNEANREDAKIRGYSNATEKPRLGWSFDGGYPIYSDSAHLPVYRIDLDDSVFVSYALTDAQGHIVDLPPAYSSKDRYFDVWVDSTGKTVTTSTVFKAPSTIYAKYSKTIKDPSLVVYRPDPTVIGWDGEMRVPTLRMHLDTSLYVAIFTPSELAWYLSKGAHFTKRAALVNDIVMGKDTLSLLDRELGAVSEFGRYIDGYVFHGNGHKIYGLNHYLFEVNYGGTIRDVHLVNSLLSRRGGAFAKTNRGEIINSSLRRAVVDTTDGGASFGGFVSVNYNGSLIDSCANYTDYDLDGVSIAGIAADNYGTISNTRNLGNMKQHNGGSVAGIATANRESGVIENCTNEGNIEYAGGKTILAGISVNNYDGSLISKSKNLGRIYARLDNYSMSVSYTSPGLVAGIVGDGGAVDSCANLGEITVVGGDQFGGGVSVGGISAGRSARTSVRNSLNQGAVTFVDSSSLVLSNVVLGGIASKAKVYSSRNEADVKWEYADSTKKIRGSEDIAVGGIVGYTSYVEDCVNDGNVAGYGFVGGIAASAGGIVFNPVDTLARVANRGRIEAYAGGWTTYAGGICGQCVYVEKALNFGSVSAKKLNDSSWISMGGIAGYGGGAYMVANTAPVQGHGQGSKVVAGGLVGYFASLGVGLSDAYNWGEVSADSLAGGVWGIYEGELLVQDRTVSSELNDYVRNIYNAAPVNASNGYPVGTALSCPDTVDTSYTALIYNDSAFSHDRSCVSLKDFDDNEKLITFYVYTSPLSTKYMQSDAFVDLLNTSGNTTADRHVWKRSQTYPVFDEAALEMSVGSKPPESSSSSGIVASSSSSKKVGSSSSSIKTESSSSSKKVEPAETSSSSNKVASSSGKVQSSSSNKAASSSSKKSGKSSSSSKGKSNALPAVALANMSVLFTGNDLVVTSPQSSWVRVQVFDMLGNNRGSFRANVSGSHVFSLQYLEQGRYLVRVNSGSSIQNLNVLIK